MITTDVFAIPLLSRYLVYAPLRRVAFITNAAGVNLLGRLRQSEVTSPSEQEAFFLQLCRDIHLIGNEGDFPIGNLENDAFKPNEVTLFLTTRCNLRCVYCYASAGDHPLAEMSLDTAKRGIDFAYHNALELGKPEFGVGYHGGGEPTMHWRVLTESFRYAQELARQHGLGVYGSMATNGVLSPVKQQWIIENFQGVNLSIDGLPAMQDRQRPTVGGKGSWTAVLRTIQAFDKANFPYGIRITVTAASVEHLPQSVEYLLNCAHPKHIQIEPIYVLGRGSNNGLAVDPLAFIEGFRQAKRIAEPSGVDFFYSAARVDVLTNRFCQSCGEGFSLTPRGQVSGCYEVPHENFAFSNEFIFGDFIEAQGRYAFDEDKLTRLRNHSVEQISWCQDCFCKWHCAGDCAYKARHNTVGEQAGDSIRCQITRTLTLDQILDKIKQSGGKVWADNSV